MNSNSCAVASPRFCKLSGFVLPLAKPERARALHPRENDPDLEQPRGRERIFDVHEVALWRPREFPEYLCAPSVHR